MKTLVEFLNKTFFKRYNLNLFFKFFFPSIVIFSFIKIYGNLGPCIPSVLMVFADTANDLKCGSSNPNIVEIGSMTTTRFSYQPSVPSFEDVFSKVTTTVTGEADVVMNVGGLTVGTEVYVEGRYYTQEYYDSYDNLIESHSRFEPFGPGNEDGNGYGNGNGKGNGNGNGQGLGNGQGSGQGLGGGSGYSLYPNSISNSQFYLDNTEGANTDCTNNYSSSCLDGTYSESVEYNPDLKSIPIDNSSAVDYSQSDYNPPEVVEKEDNEADLDQGTTPSPSNPSGSSTKNSNPTLSPELAQWKLQKIIESFNNYNDAVARSEQSTKQFEQERKALFDNYRQQIQSLENFASGLQKNYDEALKSINSYLENYTSPPFNRRSNDYYTLQTQFEYHKLDGQARKILEAQLQAALDKKNAREYAKVAEKLLNSNDYELSRPKVKVNESGILNSNLLDPSRPGNALDDLNLSKIKSAHNKELMRSVANKYQTYWAEMGGLESVSPEQILLYSVGIELLNSALDAAEAGLDIDFLTYLDGSLAFLEATTKFNLGIASGLGNKFADKIMEIPELAILVYENFGRIPTTKEEWVKFGELVVRSAPGFKKAIIDGVIQYRDDFIYGDEFKKGEVIGYIIGEAIDTFVPAGKITSVSRIMNKAEDVIQMTRLAEKLTPDLAKALKALPPSHRNYVDNILFDSDKSKVDFIKNNSDQIVSNLINVSDEDVLYTVEKLIASTAPFDASNVGKGYGIIKGQNILMQESSMVSAISKIEDLSLNLNSIEGVNVNGYISRVTKLDYLSAGESAMDGHIGNLVVPGRFGLGGAKGVDVISYGIGPDEISSLAVSRLEAGVSLDNLSLFSQAGSNSSFNKVLDLTNPQNLNALGLDIATITNANDYFLTQVVGALAQKKGFTGILAPSAKKPDGKVLHIFGMQKL